jgi:hypothetical protein
MTTYPYRASRLTLVAAIALFAACSAVGAWRAGQSEPFRVSIVQLGPEGARWLFVALAVASAAFVAIAIAGLAAPARTLVLDAGGVTVPTGLFGRRPRAVRWSEVREVTETEIAGTRIVTLELGDGRVAISNRMLGAAYAEVRAAILAATRR